MHTTPPILDAATLKTWTRDEYYRLADCGWFQSERTELIGGQIYIIKPLEFSRSMSLYRTAEVLNGVFFDGYWVRFRGPLHLDVNSEPDPGISVVAGDLDYYDHHPTTALLVVEASTETLAFDRSEKSSLYASAGIEDYWIINLVDGVLEVHRDPTCDEQQPFGHTYRSVQTLQPADTIAPLAAPESNISVGDLLPKSKASPKR